MIMTTPFFALLLLAPTLAPLGCMLLWRRMAFFGDALSHACILGVGLALLCKVAPIVGIIGIALAIAILLYLFEKQRDFAIDTVFAILSYTSLALGIILMSLNRGVHVNIEDLLFGDVLAIGERDLLPLGILGVVSVVCFVYFRRSFILQSISPELSQIYDKHHKLAQLVFLALLAVGVAFSLTLIGALMLPALMILPAAAARKLSHSPVSMILWTIGISILTSFIGLWISYTVDIPSSPSIVVMGGVMLVIVSTFNKIKHERPFSNKI